MQRFIQRASPALTLLALFAAWEALVRLAHIPHYTLPAPSLVLQTLVANFGSLAGSWWFTLKITFGALLLACAGGVLIASMFALSRGLEHALFPIAVALQVTPVVAIAPLILIYVASTTAALLLCAWIVAFFPILSNTVLGLRAADPHLRDLFRLYRATPLQRLRWLLVPSACRWIAPEVCDNGVPAPSQRRAMISAAIEIAVSSGVLAPRSNPIGEDNRPSSAAVRPTSASRFSRSWWVCRDPIAPT